MKNSRFQFEYRESASKLHIAIGEVLRTSSLFKNYQVFQEYPVSRVAPKCDNNRLHFDWVIPDLFLVIEAHGEQHEKPIDFSGKSEDGGILEFKRIRARDRLKKDLAIEAGYTYIVIYHNQINDISEDLIWSLYQENKNESRITTKESKKCDPLHEEQLSKAREYRRAAYRRAKERVALQSRRTTESSLQAERTNKNKS